MNGTNETSGETIDLERPAESAVEQFDVIIIGAGISGIGAAYHMQQHLPETSFVILDAQQSFGGTWVTHKYPGIRSDSDLYTFGYRFKPWTSAPIGTGAQILKYLGEVVEDNNIDQHIRYGHEVLTAEWNTEDAIWTISGTCKGTGKRFSLTGNFLWMCQGYYRHLEGEIPQWPGLDEFQERNDFASEMAGRFGLQRQRRGRHRIGCYRRDGGSGHRACMPTCGHAPALANVFPSGAKRDRSRGQPS